MPYYWRLPVHQGMKKAADHSLAAARVPVSEVVATAGVAANYNAGVKRLLAVSRTVVSKGDDNQPTNQKKRET
eukprot:392175-Prorocentrum_minimum.AAC.6